MRLRRAIKREANGQHARDRYSREQVGDALKKTDGLLTLAAKRLRCDYTTILRYMERYPELEEIRDSCRENMIDLAESKLKSKIKAGNLDATKFALKTVGKKRGFVERTEMAGVSDQPLSINIMPAPGVTEEKE